MLRTELATARAAASARPSSAEERERFAKQNAAADTEYSLRKQIEKLELEARDASMRIDAQKTQLLELVRQGENNKGSM